MQLRSYVHDGMQIIAVEASRIDAASAVQFKDAIRAELWNETKHAVLDLAHVMFVDSSGLGAIVACRKHMGEERSLDLAGLTPDVEKVFRLTRMDTIFGIYDCVDHVAAQKAG